MYLSSVSQAEIQEMRILIERTRRRFPRLPPSDGEEPEPDHSPLAHPAEYVAPSAGARANGRCLAILRQLRLFVCEESPHLPDAVLVAAAASLESCLFELLQEVEVLFDRAARMEFLATKERRAIRVKGDA